MVALLDFSSCILWSEFEAGLGWSLSALTSLEFLLEAEYVLYDTLYSRYPFLISPIANHVRRNILSGSIHPTLTRRQVQRRIWMDIYITHVRHFVADVSKLGASYSHQYVVEVRVIDASFLQVWTISSR